MYISILLKPSTRFRYPPDDPFGSGSLGRGVASTVRRVSYFGLRGRLRGGDGTGRRLGFPRSRRIDTVRVRNVRRQCPIRRRSSHGRNDNITFLFQGTDKENSCNRRRYQLAAKTEYLCRIVDTPSRSVVPP